MEQLKIKNNMKFGKEFGNHLEKTLPQWRDYYLRYKPLKKLLKNIPTAVGNLQPGGDAAAPLRPSPELQEWFVGILYEEVEKFNDFYVGKEEVLIIRFQALKDKIKCVKENGSNDGLFTSETEFSEEVMEIRKDFVAIHGEMVLLKSYSSLNFAGLIKILKKYDKRTGEFLTVPFTQLAFNQPFFTTAPLTSLISECESILEVLFPLEAEVVQSTAVAQEDADMPNASLETAPLLGEEAEDIYRSTLAAISTIQGLRKESSTYNPLSMSYLFGRPDNMSAGAVTAENSPCNSFVTMDSDEDDNEDIYSPE